MSSIEWQSSLGSVLVCFLLALVLTAILYFRNRTFSEQGRLLQTILPTLRFLGIFAILLLLLDPLIKSVTNDEIKPILVLAQDVSKSIVEKTDTASLGTVISQLEQTALKEKYEVHALSFSDKVVNGLDNDYSGQSTNLSKVLNHINDQYQGRNLAATLLLTDGIFNQGSHPYYSIKQSNAPVFGIALGDTTQERDLRLVDIFHNETNLLGDNFEVQIDWEANFLPNTKSKLNIRRISPSPKKILERPLKISKDNQFTSESIQLSGEIEGMHHYRISLYPVEGEYNSKNNVKDFYIEIIDSKIKILTLAKAPHPDLGMLSRIVEKSKNFELDLVYVKDVATISEEKYDLVIYHDLPSNSTALTKHFDRIKTLKTPYLMMLGKRTDIALFNEWQQVVKVEKKSAQTNYVNGEINKDFQAFVLDDFSSFSWNIAPPISTVFGDFNLKLGAQSVIDQKIGQVETNYPLIAINTKPFRHGVINGVDWWKLRMFEYLNDKEQIKIDLLFTKLIQYLSLKEDKRPLVVKSSKKLYNSNEAILFNGILRNDNYEAVNEADLKIVLKNSEGKSYEYLMDRDKKTYRLDIGSLPASDYSYTAESEYNRKKYSTSGKFSIQDVQLENNLLQANHQLIDQISQGTGGRLFYPNQLNTLVDTLLNEEMGKIMLAENVRLSQLIDKKWILFLLACLFFIEWILRKYFGAY